MDPQYIVRTERKIQVHLLTGVTGACGHAVQVWIDGEPARVLEATLHRCRYNAHGRIVGDLSISVAPHETYMLEGCLVQEVTPEDLAESERLRRLPEHRKFTFDTQ